MDNKKRHEWAQTRNVSLARRPGRDAQTSFYDAMQPEARQAAAPIGGQSWRVYAMVVRCPHALDLAQTNPALATEAARQARLELATRWLTASRVSLELLGFSA